MNLISQISDLKFQISNVVYLKIFECKSLRYEICNLIQTQPSRPTPKKEAMTCSSSSTSNGFNKYACAPKLMA